MSESMKCIDLSGGKENHQVKFHCKFLDSGHTKFTYVKTNIPGPDCNVNQFTELFAGCNCEQICCPETCSCIKQFGCAYNQNERLDKAFVTCSVSKPVLECGVNCSCSDSCKNRVVQKGVKHCFEVFASCGKGFGLKTGSSIPQLDFVCEYAGEVVTEKVAKQIVKDNEQQERDNYLIVLREHVDDRELCTCVDPSSIGNLGRFINHSCDPNLVMVPVRTSHQVPRLALFARKNIQAGEELTFDYSGHTLLHPGRKRKICHGVNPLASKGKSEIEMIGSVSERKVKKLYTNEETNDSKDHTRITEEDNHNKHSVYSGNMVSHTAEDTTQNSVSGNKTIEDCSSVHAQDISNKISIKTVEKKICLCDSKNCSGYLPFDKKLLVD